MKHRLAWLLRVATPLTAVVAVAGAIPAGAHEPRATGGFQFVVGWGEEPAYTGFKNSVQVTISEANGGPPVTDLGDSLEVEVGKGSERMTLPLEPGFRVGGPGTPGDYRAWLTPTRPGAYTFRLTGSIRGQAVNESFTSSPTTFDEVQDVAAIQFPAKDPSTGELATRIEREVPRLEARTASVEAGLRDVADRVDTSRTLAVVGVVTGAVGLLTAAGAVVALRRSGARGRPGARDGTARPDRAGSLSR
ncbi:MAG TPA: hypothetical protein VHF27_09125 [Acidimicrobiales bacterium]|nr:hypothetical protein [Acidimicrobiales bacterium]